MTGLQGIFFRNEPLTANWSSGLALASTLLLGLFISAQLFRWEKEEKIRPMAKLWVLAVLCPFLILGTYQAYSREYLRKAKILMRDMDRSATYLIRGVRIFVGDGRVIESGGVLVKKGKIEEVFADHIPSANELKASVIEGSGKTLIPGLIDALSERPRLAPRHEFPTGVDHGRIGLFRFVAARSSAGAIPIRARL